MSLAEIDPRPLGERAVLVRLSYPPGVDSHAQLDTAARQARMTAARMLAAHLQTVRPEWSGQLVTGYDSVLVPFDPQIETFARLRNYLLEQARQLEAQRQTTGPQALPVPRRHRLPVVYGGKYGLDLPQVARQTGLSEADIIRLHITTVYTVYLVGFAAGYAYMGATVPALDLPRLSRPRPKVPRGSVAVAAGMTGVYPVDMPGGWHLLGYTPYAVFRADCDPPVRFLPGDEVEFYPVEETDLPGLAARGQDFAASLEPGNA